MATWAAKNDLDRAVRRRRVGEMVCDGYRYEDVAEAVGVDISTVSRDMGYLTRSVLREMTERLAEFKAKQTLRVEALHRKALRGYELSQQDKRRTTTKVKRKEKFPAKEAETPEAEQTKDKAAKTPDEVEQDTVVEPQAAGNVAFLTEARKCLEEVSKLWGIHAPVQTQLVDAEGNDVLGAALERMPVDTAAAFLEVIREAKRLRLEQQALPNPEGRNGEVIDVEAKPCGGPEV